MATKAYSLRVAHGGEGDWASRLSELLTASGRPGGGGEQLFAHLTQGIPTDEFLASVFEKQPVHFSRGAGLVGQKRKASSSPPLFSRDELLAVVERHSLGALNNMTLTKWASGKRVDKQTTASGGPLEKKELQGAFKNGYTVQFYQPQRFVDGLWKINSSFEHVFGTLAGASAYLTPAGKAQGLEPHHDDCEVFVLQTEGSKVWRLHLDKSAHLPDYYAKNLCADRLQSPVEVTLHSGDLLYLPRGIIHEAQTTDEFSTHVTISVYQHYSYKTLLNKLLPKLTSNLFKQSEEMRAGLPVRMQSLFGTCPPPPSAVAGEAEFVAQRRQEMLLRVKRLLAEVGRGGASERELEQLVDETADDLAADFVENRLPPPFESLSAGAGASASGGASGGRVKLIDAALLHVQIEQDDEAGGGENSKEIALYSAWGNDRKRHMGHPTEPGDDDDDDGDDGGGGSGSGSGSDDEEEDEEDEEMHTARFPVHYAPLISALRAAPFIDEGKIYEAVAGMGISRAQVSEAIALLRERRLLCDA